MHRGHSARGPETGLLPESHEKSININLKLLSQGSNAVMCHLCGQVIHAYKFESHFSDEHGPTPGCVWCDEISGTRPEKLDSIPAKRPSSQDIFLARNEDLLEPPPPPELPLFPDDSLNLAATYVSLFLAPKGSHAWYHVTVAQSALDSFIRAMDEDEGNSTTLEFSCWCDAGPCEDVRRRQHWHLVVVSPARHFERHVWPKVVGPDPCKTLTRIESPAQLVETLGSLTDGESTCERGASTREGSQMHFRLTRSLPATYRLPLSLLWEGGLEEALYEHKFKKEDLSRVLKGPVSLVGGLWRQKIRDFPGLKMNIVVPVSRGLQPTRVLRREPPQYTFHLLEGKKVHFYYSRAFESLDEGTLEARQAKGGNCFYSNIGEAMWTLGEQEEVSRRMLSQQGEGNKEPGKETEGPQAMDGGEEEEYRHGCLV